MDEFKMIIAGGRDFSDMNMLERVILNMSDVEFADKKLSIVSGMARGADALGYKFAHSYGVQVYEFPAHWVRYGKKAGYMRNTQMGDFADGLLAFWDGDSKGTGHMINYMRSINKPVTIVGY